ncbi:MAG TPA: response regulator [Phycisphaerae bacterium]|nr:response regulator [Phycisphaerae bacterium]HOJ74817.1 response regulator [Phycisphaerae bacterium]HOM51980.1 response regulator [Phycisphaerae bacterium]HOQ87384.1 response regulator [Phycisphaerae bacterium]HPP27396.1 response regulator [Phycisphaerae bacterium]
MPSQQCVYLIDDDPAIHDGLDALFGSVGLDVRSFSSAQEFLDFAHPGLCGCMIIDLRMPGMSGLELLATLRERQVALPAILLTGYADVPTAIRAMKDGAFDLIEKPFSGQTLLDCVWRAIEFDRQRRYERDQTHLLRERFSKLSQREWQVLDLVVAGCITKEIAARLDLSPKTVENHRARIMDKTRAGGVADLVRMYYTVRGDLKPPVEPLSHPASVA